MTMLKCCLAQELDEARQREHEAKQREDAALRQLAPLVFTDLLALCHQGVTEVQVESL